MFATLKSKISLFPAILLTLGLSLAACDDGGGNSSSSSTKDIDIGEGRSLGDPNAPIKMVEYASTTCGHCANFHVFTFKKLKEEYIDTGKIHFTFREFPTPPAQRAVAGFLLANCVSDDRYFDMLDVLFRQQSVWVPAPDSFQALRPYAQSAGLNSDQYKACLSDQDEINRILAVQDNAQELGVNSTPTFLINGEVYTNRPYEDLVAIIEPLLPEDQRRKPESADAAEEAPAE